MSDPTRFTYRSDCGCTLSGQLNAACELVNTGGILRCPLHEAAPKLAEACEAAESILRAYIPAENFDGHAARALESVRAALALARPTTPTEKGR